jgi:uncharacterized protein YlxP (DUF503 family)
MAKAKNNYVNTELDWAEQQLRSWREYVDTNPIHQLEDRKAWKELKGGGQMPVTVATIEQQIKCIQDTMDKYLKLLEVVNNLREKEEQKQIQSRGDKGLSPFETGDI